MHYPSGPLLHYGALRLLGFQPYSRPFAMGLESKVADQRNAPTNVTHTVHHGVRERHSVRRVPVLIVDEALWSDTEAV